VKPVRDAAVGSLARRCEQVLRDAAMGYPEAHEEFPWGHRAIKVKKKIFFIVGCNQEGLSLSLKLPESNLSALDRPFTEPTGYGLGKSGWVSAQFGMHESPPMELLLAWIDESYRAIAPKQLVALLDGISAPAARAAGRPAKRKARPRKKP
jgi:predicted DNA-binding protein (MmcQ/YjbR family)